MDAAVNTRRDTLQSKVARLRRAFGDPLVIAGGDGGCKLALELSAVDALAVLRDAAAAAALLEASDDRGAAELSAAALHRYRGDVLPAAGDGDWVQGTATVITQPSTIAALRTGCPVQIDAGAYVESSAA